MKVSPTTQKTTITMNTRTQKTDALEMAQWWMAGNDRDLAGQLLTTAAFLKETQQYRYRSAAIFAKLYGNQSIYSFVGSNISKMDQNHQLPLDRPTFNIIQSATDTLVSRISQSRPQPVFLTDNGDYRQRNLAKKLNNFIQGEFYSTKTYEKAALVFRDALVEGTGVLKIYENDESKVAIERVLLTELLNDPNESIYGEPRQLYQLKLIDRKVLESMFTGGAKKNAASADKAFPDSSADSSKTVSDMVMVVEGWRLPSKKGATDGRHTIACTSGVLFDETYENDKFPFVFIHYSPRLLGFWAQGLAEQLMGTQLEINSLLYTISKAIKLVGVPRVFIEDSSKVVSAHNNNDVGVIIKYRGIKPIYETAPCNAPELYEQLQRLIGYGFQQCGVSAMQASGQKPAGLNSGEAQRVYDDIATDRFASLAKRYDELFTQISYQIIELASDIAKRDGKYSTVYPNKNGVKEVDLTKADLVDDCFVIQCFNMSSLPRDPAGRMQKITEMIQAGMITIKEGRRLLDYPDLEQMEKLANASEERIYQILDDILEKGIFQGPDPFMDLQLANDTVVQYYNLYSSAKLEEEKCEMLRDFYKQVQDLKQAAMPPAPIAPPNIPPQAQPQPQPQSPLVPNANPGQ
jgi:hypothetical protein